MARSFPREMITTLRQVAPDLRLGAEDAGRFWRHSAGWASGRIPVPRENEFPGPYEAYWCGYADAMFTVCNAVYGESKVEEDE